MIGLIFVADSYGPCLSSHAWPAPEAKASSVPSAV